MKGAAVGGASWAVWRLIRRQNTGPAAPKASFWPTVDAAPPSANDHGRVQASARPVLGVPCAPAFDSACADHACEINACLQASALLWGDLSQKNSRATESMCAWVLSVGRLGLVMLRHMSSHRRRTGLVRERTGPACRSNAIF